MTDKSNETLDILVIGTGFSGICAGIRLLQNGSKNFRIVEKSQGIGGTWWDNTYPGAACDVPSHFYCFSFEPNPNWSRVYSPQAEIQEYLENCVDKYGVRPHIEHGMKVESLIFDDTNSMWEAHFQNGRVIRARHVINGSGGLHQAVWPDIPGRDSFSGPSMHTAHWDHSVDYKDKRVAIIGSAASAIQVIPAIADDAADVEVFQRTANYIVPRNDREYTDREKKRFARWPWLLRLYRKFIFLRMDMLLYPITRQGSWYGQQATRKIIQYIRETVDDPALHDALIPDFTIGCKRILISDDIYTTLNRDDVTLVTTAISTIEGKGIRTADNRLHEADIIVYATGYDVEAHGKSIKIIGPNQHDLEGDWQNGAEAYNGCCVTGIPNYYMVTGPNTGVGTTSVVFMIEQEVEYILKLIAKAGSDSTISVRPEAQAQYNVRISEELKGSVWASGCKSWYRRDDGKIVVLYPGSARTFRKQLRDVNFNHFEQVPTAGSGEQL